MARFVQLQQIGPGLFRAKAIIEGNSVQVPENVSLVEMPKDVSSNEILGSFYLNGEWLGKQIDATRLNWGAIVKIPDVTSKVSIIIPTFSGGEKLDTCLKTFIEHHKNVLDYEIIVVIDGGPHKEDIHPITSKYDVLTIALQENLGFSAAINAGLREVRPASDFVILANDDLRFFMPSCLVLAGEMQQREDAALVGSLLLYPNGKVQHAGKISASEHFLHGKDLTAEAFIDRELMGVTGALLGINRKFLDQVLKLDESYHMAWEDADLCLTAHTLGWKVFYCGRACAYHDEGGTRGSTPKQKKEYSAWMTWENKGREVFENKWGTEYARKKWRVKPKRTLLNRLILKRTTALGDVLLTTPIVHALREKKPDWEIIIATSHPFIYRDNPDVNYIVPPDHEWVESKDCEAFYDLDLSYEMRPDTGILKAYAGACNVNVKDPRPRVYLREQNRSFASNLLSDSCKWTVIHTGPKGWPGGDWPWERFSEVAEALQKKGLKVVLIGNTPPDPIKCDLDLRHKTSFHNLAAILERSSLFVGIDSMPLHLAQAFKKPCVGVFGCVDPSHILIEDPFVRGVTADQSTVSCLGCHHRGTFPKTVGICDKDKVYCMEKLPSEKVIGVIDELLMG